MHPYNGRFRQVDHRGLDPGSSSDGLGVILARVGVCNALVPAPSWNIKVTTQDDWLLAQDIERGGGPV